MGADGCRGAPLLKRHLFLLSSLSLGVDVFFPVGIFDFCRSAMYCSLRSFSLSLFVGDDDDDDDAKDILNSADSRIASTR